MQLRKILPVAAIAAATLAGTAGTASATGQSYYSAAVACDAATSQAKITFTDTDPTSTKVFLTVYAAGTSTPLAHTAIVPNAGFGDSISVEVPWTPDGAWDINVTEGPLQMAQLSVRASNTGCGTVAGPAPSKPASGKPSPKPKPKPKPTHSGSAPTSAAPAGTPTTAPTLADTGSSGTAMETGAALAAVALGAAAVLVARRRAAARHN